MTTEHSRRSPAPVLPAALTVLMVVAAVLAAGFLGEFSADPVIDGTVAPSVQEITPAPTVTADPEPQVDDRERLEVDGGAMAALVLILVMAGLALLARFLLSFRTRDTEDRRDPEPADVRAGESPAPAPMPEALAIWTEEARQALESEVDTSHAVIRCWLELERLSAAAGVQRRAAQTTSDFATALSRSLDLPSLPLTSLTGLYQRARFGGSRDGRALTTTDRDAALSAIWTLSVALAARHPHPRHSPSPGRRA